MGEVKLLGGWSSPFVNRVEMALKIKGIDYEYVEEDFSSKSSLLLESNPIHKKVPVLIHNGKPIVESMIIIEYIDEVWEGTDILPKDPYQRAMARFWAKFIDEKCASTLFKACGSKGEEHEKLKEESNANLKFLENEIKGKKFFGGDTIGFVDISANTIAYWIPIFSELAGVELITEKEFPNLCRWTNEYCSNSLVKEYLPNKEAMIKKIQSK